MAYWLGHNSADTVLIALTEGDLGWDKQSAVFAGLGPRRYRPLSKIGSRPSRDGLIYAPIAMQRPTGIEFMERGADFAAAVRGSQKRICFRRK